MAQAHAPVLLVRWTLPGLPPLLRLIESRRIEDKRVEQIIDRSMERVRGSDRKAPEPR